jgi:hypothetical protein
LKVRKSSSKTKKNRREKNASELVKTKARKTFKNKKIRTNETPKEPALMDRGPYPSARGRSE